MKDVKALFKQKAVIGTLLVPMLLMIGFGLIPLLSSIEEPFEVTLFNEDEGVGSINLGTNISDAFESFFNSDDLKLKNVDNYEDFISSDNGIWLPANFSRVANQSNVAVYFAKISDTNLRSQPVMYGLVPTIIGTVISTELLKPVVIPTVQFLEVFKETDIIKQGEVIDRGGLAFPLVYMSFLILILASSAIRITGFSAEKNAGMMELLLASVKNRKELVLSKLLTGVIYGLSSVLSYVIGALIAIQLISGLSTGSDSELDTLLFAEDVLTEQNLIIISVLFVFLIFTSMEIMLTAQLILGKDSGDRLGSTANMILSFLFYLSLLTNPLAETPTQLVNPFFWSYRTALNIAFNENWGRSIIYIILNLTLVAVLLKIMTNAIEKEKVLFDE